MDFADYKSFWNQKAVDANSAMAAVDGSPDEHTLRLTGRYSARQVSAALDLRADDRVFEIGCGVGRIGRELIEDIGHWHGLDISEGMLDVARGRLAAFGNTRLNPLVRSRLDPLPDAGMDKGYCVAVFIHMDKEDFALYLRDVARVLRPGGLFYFDHWNLAHPVGWRRFGLELEFAAAQAAGGRKDVARNQFTVPEEARLLVEHAGLEWVGEVCDSPWLQVVVRRPDGDAAALEAERARVAGVAAVIGYGAAWTRYFDALLQAEQAGEAPRALAEALAADPSEQLVEVMFRHWLAGNWRNQSERWGPLPVALRARLENA